MVDEARRHLLGAAAITVPLVLFLLFLPSRFVRGVAVSLHIATFIYFKAWYSALPWALLALFLFLLSVGLIGAVLAIAGADVPD